MKDVRGVAGWGAPLSESVGRKGRGLTETVKINIFAMVKSSTSKKVFPVGLKKEENRKGKQEATASLAAAKEDSVLAKAVAVYLKEVDGIFTFKNKDK